MPSNLKIFNEQALPQKTLSKQDYDLSKDVLEGFTSGEIINSKVFNTILNATTKILAGFLNTINYNGLTIDESSKKIDIENYIKNGLKEYIQKTSPSPTLINNDTQNNANVNFTIAGQQFNKTINNVSNANSSKSADKLSTQHSFNIGGDATGRGVNFDGTQDVTIQINVNKSDALKSVNIGSDGEPVYFDATGKPVKMIKVKRATNADSADSVEWVNVKNKIDFTKIKVDSSKNADNATSANYAISAGSATNSTNATNAVNATNATNANYANTSGSANSATNATNSTNSTNINVDGIGMCKMRYSQNVLHIEKVV